MAYMQVTSATQQDALNPTGGADLLATVAGVHTGPEAFSHLGLRVD